MSYTRNTYDITKIEKDYWHIKVNGVDFGTWERSELRHLMETIDKEVN